MSKPSSAHRCGECANCKKLDLVQRRVLACCNPPFSHADDGVVKVWNDMLARLTCVRVEANNNKRRT